MHVRFSDRAEADLDQIHDYRAEESQTAAFRVTHAILMAATYLEAFPL